MKIIPQRKPKAIIFIGFRHKKNGIIESKEAGYKTILLTRHALPITHELFDEVIEGEMLEPEFIDSLMPIIKEKYLVKGIISNYEHYVVPRSYLAERFCIPSTSVYGACCSRNKAMMRHALSFMEENIESQIVTNEKEAQTAFKQLGGDVYIKSIAGIKSRLVFHATTPEKVTSAITNLKSTSQKLDLDLYDDYKYCNFQFHYPNPHQTFLVEKAIHGQQITISSLAGSHTIWHTPSVCDVYTAKEINRDDSFLAFRITPSKHPIEIIQKAKHVTETAAHILGLRYCPLFCELILTPQNEIKLIEIASRQGGYRSQMYQSAYGINIDKQLVKAVIGKKVTTRSKAIQYISFIEIFPATTGKFSHIDNLDLIENNPNIDHLEQIAQKGDAIGKARDNFSPVLRFSLKGKTYDEVYEKSLEFQNKLIVQTD